jgi:hypothetical protein
MTERERLKEFIREAEAKCASIGQCRLCEQYGKGGDCQRELIADHLLANGVIVLDTSSVDVVTNREPIRTAFGMPLDELSDLIRAKQQGNLIVPPCKVGDTVYRVMRDKRIKQPYEYKVVGFWYAADEKCNDVHLVRYVNGMFDSSISIPFSEFGKITFLSREEAEKALAERSKQCGSP